MSVVLNQTKKADLTHQMFRIFLRLYLRDSDGYARITTTISVIGFFHRCNFIDCD